jgi:hypothetical protein
MNLGARLYRGKPTDFEAFKRRRLAESELPPFLCVLSLRLLSWVIMGSKMSFKVQAHSFE